MSRHSTAAAAGPTDVRKRNVYDCETVAQWWLTLLARRGTPSNADLLTTQAVLIDAVLYMAAVAATRHNPDLGRKYRDLIGRGKPPKVALVAVMRKLLLLANVLLRPSLRAGSGSTGFRHAANYLRHPPSERSGTAVGGVAHIAGVA